MSASMMYPILPVATLRDTFCGKHLRDIDGPAAIIDVAVARRNCAQMRETAERLHVGFRAHVKTHKTIDLTRLQVGEKAKDIKLIVSTVAEAEHLLPFLLESKKHGKNVNVIYGVPPSSSCLIRLRHLQDLLGPDSISFLIDHPRQLQILRLNPMDPTAQISIFVKIDTGYHRAGITSQSEEFRCLLDAIQDSRNQSTTQSIKLAGFYSHFGSSYGVSSPIEALAFLAEEVEKTAAAAEQASAMGFGDIRFTLSVGATPTASSARALLLESPEAAKVKELFTHVQQSHDIELHGGVYPLRDLQQLATYSKQFDDPNNPTMSTSDIGIRILAEVLSLYSDREKPEALIGAGTLALGREPCKNYSGWAIVAPTPWQEPAAEIVYDENKRTGWILDRISQEHGILTWEGPRSKIRNLNIGEKLLLWPNHACVAGAGFDWYLVVDSDLEDSKSNVIIDVWVRCRGW